VRHFQTGVVHQWSVYHG